MSIQVKLKYDKRHTFEKLSLVLNARYHGFISQDTSGPVIYERYLGIVSLVNFRTSVTSIWKLFSGHTTRIILYQCLGTLSWDHIHVKTQHQWNMNVVYWLYTSNIPVSVSDHSLQIKNL